MKEFVDFEKLFLQLVSDNEESIVDDQDDNPHYKIFKDFFKDELFRKCKIELDECNINTAHDECTFSFSMVTEGATESDNNEHGCSFVFVYADDMFTDCCIEEF